MFDIGWSEMLVIAIVVIVVVGPKELPGMLRTFGKTTAKLRVMANDFRKQFDEAMKEAELDELKNLASDARKLNPANQIKQALSPMEQAARDVKTGLDSALQPNTSASAPSAETPDAETPAAAEPAGETSVQAAMKEAVQKATAATAATAAAASAAAPAEKATTEASSDPVAAGAQTEAGGAKS